ncbi:SRPBCC family protein [Niallia nealsonii]|uniref:Activator of Hsp90 ATPase 1 family protein n=1 Tax=Niallia nealsonii TaxID=115979 RepID=A0A2N0Z1I0_9BACI|nr:SRPBCC family protein [Niallia nealsonii]PKG23364.1 activator of Hsp90 ATPase 1 family protein [Niallia nealsonii]
MLAVIGKNGEKYRAIYNRYYHYSIEEVWAILTENDHLKNWMSNLQVEELRKNGRIKFFMNDGTNESIDMKIMEYDPLFLLQFEWGEGSVRFELAAEEGGCFFQLKEYIEELNDHAAKDLAGWHECLELFEALLKGQKLDFSMERWENWHKEYRRVLKRFIE